LRQLAPTALALAVTSAFAGQVTLYENSEFKGRYVTIGEDVAVVTRPGYVDAASSMVVASGTWEACTDTHFRGRCAQVGPGNYPTLDESLKGKISSLREIAYLDRAVRVVVAPQPVVVAPQPVVVAAQPGTVAPPPVVVTSAPVANAPQQVIVTPAPVVNAPQVVVSPTTAVVSAPAAASTVQPIVVAPAVAPTPVVSVVQPVVGRAVLYEDPNFAGARVVIDRGQAKDLEWANFRNPSHRATSIHIESGTWIVCTEIAFQGECHMLGPGEYPRLSGPLATGVSSAQQVWRPEYVSLNVYTR
jgi:hypothetical protein